MVRLQTCCCCSLRTGALIIGYINIGTSLTLLVLAIVQLSSRTDIDEQFLITIAEILTGSCLTLLVDSLMVYGVLQGKPGFLIAWLALKCIGLVVSTVLEIILIAQVFVEEADGPLYFTIFGVIPLMLALAWYLYLVVYCHYKELCDGPSFTRPQNKTSNYSDDPTAIVLEK